MKNITLRLRTASLLAILAVLGLSNLSVKAVEATKLTTANNLYSTGVQNDDLTLVAPDPAGLANPADLHWTVSYFANGSGGAPASVLPPSVYSSGYYGVPDYTGSAFITNRFGEQTLPGVPFDNWAPNLGDSQWISYSPNRSETVQYTPNTGVSVYQLVLTDIPTGDLVTLNANVASDDSFVMYVNGQKLFSNFNVTDNGTNNGWNYASYTALNGLQFVSGDTNTIDFVVYNNGGLATGLNAELQGYYVAAVPEPSTYALLVAGLVALFVMSRRKRATARI